MFGRIEKEQRDRRDVSGRSCDLAPHSAIGARLFPYRLIQRFSRQVGSEKALLERAYTARYCLIIIVWYMLV